jgi:hypothetical protein
MSDRSALGGIKTHIGYNQDSRRPRYDAECAALARALETAARRQTTPESVTIVADAQAAIKRMASEEPGPGQPDVRNPEIRLWTKTRTSSDLRTINILRRRTSRRTPHNAGSRAGNAKSCVSLLCTPEPWEDYGQWPK